MELLLYKQFSDTLFLFFQGYFIVFNQVVFIIHFSCNSIAERYTKQKSAIRYNQFHVIFRHWFTALENPDLLDIALQMR